MWQLRQYRRVFSEFYLQCNEGMRAAVDAYLEALQEQGNQAREPVSKYVEDGILECRPRAGGQQARLLYFFQRGKVIVIAVALFKDQRKLSRASIEQAKRIRALIEAGKENISGVDIGN